MAFTFPRHPIHYPFHTFRGTLVQPFFFALFFLSPVLHVLQFDVIHNQLIAWGNVYPLEPVTLQWLPFAFFGCVLIIAFSSTLWGRLFCGWVCPHNALTEWTEPLRQLIGIGEKSFRLKSLEQRWPWTKWVSIGLSLLWATAITYLIATLFAFYFVPVDWYITHLLAGTLPPILVIGQALMMLIGFFMVYVGHEFCRNACPYGLFQAFSAYLIGKHVPMEIRYHHGLDTSACKQCHACQTSCPVDIDPRHPDNLVVGIGAGCFNCGECIDACHYVRKQHDQPGLLSFKSPFSQDDRLSSPEKTIAD